MYLFQTKPNIWIRNLFKCVLFIWLFSLNVGDYSCDISKKLEKESKNELRTMCLRARECVWCRFGFPHHSMHARYIPLLFGSFNSCNRYASYSILHSNKVNLGVSRNKKKKKMNIAIDRPATGNSPMLPVDTFIIKAIVVFVVIIIITNLWFKPQDWIINTVLNCVTSVCVSIYIHIYIYCVHWCLIRMISEHVDVEQCIKR